MEPCDFLTWDSEFFGRRIARVRREFLCAQGLSAALKWCERERIDCLYLLVESGDSQTLALAGECDFRLVDVRVTLERRLATRLLDVHLASDRPGWWLRPFRTADLPTLETLAANCFRQTRFYADPRFAGPMREWLYPTWIRRSCEGGAAQVLVMEVAGELAGVVTCEHSDEATIGQIGLLAVRAEFRGMGVGAKLVDAAVRWFAAETPSEFVRVVTQGANIVAQRTYQKANFWTYQTQLWWHRWFDKTPVQPRRKLRASKSQD